MSASGVAVRLAALIGCCVTGLAAQEGERPRQATYELVVPRAGSRETTPLADWDRLAQGGVLLFDDESEGTVYDRLEAQLRLALTGIDEGTLELQVVERSEGALVIDAVGSEAGHAALRAALERLQQALDAATLRFQVRLLRAAPGGEAVEVARLRARLQDGGEGGARVLRPHAWLSYEQDSSGAFPRVRPVVVPLHEGLLVSLAARRASDSSLEVHAELAYVSQGAEPRQVAWPQAGPQTLPEFVRFSCDTTLRLTAGEAVAVAERVEPDGARVWFELELLAAEAGPAQRELCLGLASDLQPGANVPWYDPLDRPQRGGGGAGAGGFSFEDEPLRSGPLELVEQLVRVEFGRWVLPGNQAQRDAAVALDRAWAAAHPGRALELAWGTPRGPGAAAGTALPVGVARRVSLQVVTGRCARLVAGGEVIALQGVHSVIAGPEGEPPQRADVPLYGSPKHGAEVAVTALADGVLSVSWSLADPPERELREVGGFPLTFDRRWGWQGEAELTLEGAAWTLVGEAQRPDGAPVALYARYAPE